MATLNKAQMIELAKQFRNPTTSAVDKIKILQAVPKTKLTAFEELVEQLAQGPLDGVTVYTNKAGQQSGYIVHATGTGKRGLYLSNESFDNIDDIVKVIKAYKK